MKATPLRLAALALFLPMLAQAHPGHMHDASFVDGALHPFLGIDHLLLLVVAGALAARLRGHALSVPGALFLGLVGAGAVGAEGAWSYAAGFLLTCGSLIAIIAAAIRLAPRTLTAISRR